VLGRLRHFSFQNLASDDHLPADHWFWNPEISGGIFVEHGVHFFDAATWLLGGQPREVQALEVARGRDAPVDTAIATALHPGGATATYTHIFTRPHQAEYQQTMLAWDAARAVVSGWIPVELRLEAWTDPQGAALLRDLVDRADELLEVPDFRRSGQERITVHAIPAEARPRFWHGGGQARSVSHHIRVHATLGGAAVKQHVYLESVRAGIADLAAAVSTHREPLVPGRDAWESLATALAAHQAARSGQRVAPPTLSGPAPGSAVPALIS
jgi:predicted dehydrogenase